MKISLVVAQGVHAGKVIPVGVPEFLIGRDPQCQLRPASPAISKQHCAVLCRDGKVFIRDYGSTNGTFINGEQVSGDREIANDDRLKAGPLEFFVRWEAVPGEAAAPASVPAASAAKPAPAKKAAEPAAAKVAAPPPEEQDSDQFAAMLLGMDDGEATTGDQTAEGAIPDGTTVMDLPSVGGQNPAKKDEKKPNPNNADTSSAAAAILSKYMRRPRT